MVRQRLSKEICREQLLNAAMKCFSEKSYHGATVNDIIVASGRSKGALYWYFSSKEEIFLAVVDRWYQKALDDLKDDLEIKRLNFTDVGKRVIERMYRYINKERSFLLTWIEFASAASRDENIRKNLIEITNRYQHTLSSCLKELVRQGEIKEINVPAMTTLLSALHDGFLFNGVIWPEKFAQKKTLKGVMTLLAAFVQED